MLRFIAAMLVGLPEGYFSRLATRCRIGTIMRMTCELARPIESGEKILRNRLACLGRNDLVAKSTLLGAAGEYYVMSVLLRHGFIAALAPVGVPNCDIVVTDDVGDRLCAVQVKTRIDKGGDGGWHMSRKHESIRSPGLFYAFLDFGKSLTAPPACFVVPSEVVADVVRRAHRAWLEAPGAKGQVRNDTDFRRFLPDFESKGLMIGSGPGWLEPYREAWASLAVQT